MFRLKDFGKVQIDAGQRKSPLRLVPSVGKALFLQELNWLVGHTKMLQIWLFLGAVLAMIPFSPIRARAESMPNGTKERLARGFSDWRDSKLQEISLGAMVGDPTALSSRFYLGSFRALSVQLGRNFNRLSGYQATTDLIVYLFDPFEADRIEIDAYIGPGLAINFWDEESATEDNGAIKRNRTTQWTIGLRGAVGISTYLQSPSLELSIELAPVVNVGSRTLFGLQFGAGLFYRFPMT